MKRNAYHHWVLLFLLGPLMLQGSPPENTSSETVVMVERMIAFEQYGTAQALLARASNAEDPRIVYLAGMLSVHRNEYEAAKGRFQRILAYNPQDPLARCGMMALAASRGDSTGVDRHLSFLIETHGLDNNSLMRLAGEACLLGVKGDPLFAEGFAAQARACFRLAIAADRSDPYARIGMGRTLSRCGEYKHALVHLDRACKQAPGLMMAFYYRGLTHKRSGNLPVAQIDFAYCRTLDQALIERLLL